jgi:hypothetical protein
MTTLKNNLKRVEKSYITDIERILKDLKSNYIITTLSGDDVSLTELIKSYSPKEQETFYQCSAILNNGNRCSHKSLKDTNYFYCKKHMFKFQKEYYNKNTILTNTKIDTTEDTKDIINVTDTTIDITEDTAEDIINVTNVGTYLLNNDLNHMKKHFIDDTLYYHDNKFIYKNINGVLKKQGYVELEQEKLIFNLINDPFLLNQL